jgi:hypothetical protein
VLRFTRPIEESGLLRLQGLKLATLERLASSQPMVNEFIDGPVSIVSDLVTISLDTVSEYVEVERDEFTLTSLKVNQSASTHDQSRKDGYSYFEGAGELIQQVLVLRESMLALYRGKPFLEVEIDSGVVLACAKSAIAISKRGFHGPDFAVTIAPSLSEVEVFDSANEWLQSLSMSYEFGHKLIDVGLLVRN